MVVLAAGSWLRPFENYCYASNHWAQPEFRYRSPSCSMVLDVTRSRRNALSIVSNQRSGALGSETIRRFRLRLSSVPFDETDQKEAERPLTKKTGTKRISLPEAMEARSVSEIPRGREWQYEPKWDGFRCLLGRFQNAVAMQSKSGQDLRRYFPEIAAAAITLPERDYVLDGELVIPTAGGYSFDKSASADSPRGKQDKKARRRDVGLVCGIRSVEAKRERSRRHEAERPARRA